MLIGKVKNKIKFEIIHCESKDFKDVTEFWFKSNKRVKNLKITINVSEFIDEFYGIDQMLSKKNEWNFLVGYENVKENQNWKFTFSGNTTDNDEKFYTSVNYKI